MAAPSDWRTAMGFSNRLTTVLKITSAWQSSDPGLSPADARREATLLETQIYDEASSAEDYDQKCEDKVGHLVQQRVHCGIPEDEEDAVSLPSPTGLDIGKYKKATYHQEGLFSVVYKAKVPDNLEGVAPEKVPQNKLVALKVTTPSMMEPPHDSKREARVLGLAASDNVMPLIETFREDGTRFVLVFPFMPYDFDQLLHNDKLSAEQIRNCLRDLFSALAFIHSHDIIHRDIKPSNMMVKSLDGPAYLTDFGIAWASGIAGSEPADSKITDVGTTCYRAPELLFGNKRYGCSLDMWAAGCTVAEAIVPGHPTLFDSGELGSELALIQSLFKKLGTPNLTVWPEATKLPDWGKMQFYEYPPQPWSSLMPKASDVECDLVGGLIRYESGDRMTAAKALRHPYFSQ